MSYNISFTILDTTAKYFKLKHLRFYIMILPQMSEF